MATRRMVLGAGLGGLALVATGATWRVTRVPKSAFEPWNIAANEAAGDGADVRLHAFRHAILAPNPHNRQPWLIRLIGTNEALITCDLERRLPVTDPFDRQITIGFGTFLELARIAAAQVGIRMGMELFPDGEPEERLDSRPVARLTFTPDGTLAADPLFGQITQRHSNKEPYDLSRAVPDDLLRNIAKDGAEHSNDPAFLAQLRDVIQTAIEAEITSRPAYMESVDLMRIGHQQIDASPDGIDLSGPMIEAGQMLGLVNHEELADMESTAYGTGLTQLLEAYGSIPALMWITTPGNSRSDQMEAGRAYVRANLTATSHGLSMHPMSQSLQEYREVAPMFAKVHELLGAEGENAGKSRVQMLARVGYGPTIGPSPRWPMEAHLL